MLIQRIKTVCIASALLVAATSCDITTEPKSTVTDATIFQDKNNYRAFLAKLYAGLVVTGQQGPHGNGDFQRLDEGFTQYTRQLWQLQTLPTDEAVIGWGDAGLPEMIFQTWASANQFVQMMYSRVFYQVSLVNEFLRETTDEKLAERGHSDMSAEIADYRAEARFLRALSYWHGIDLFGDIPLVTEESGLGSTPPEQSTRQAIFDYIVSELTAIKGDLPAAGAGQYGRADQGALSMLLAKVYMNAEVYVGTDRYSDAMTELNTILAGTYELNSNYHANFLADNHTSLEIIFAVPQDGVNTRTWGNLTFLAHASCGGSMDNADYGLDGCWWGLRAQPELVAMFPAPQDASPDGRAIFYTDGQNLQIASISNFNDGWAAPKYQNVTSTGEPGSHGTYPDTDYPMFRLADAYLMYAELHLRGGGGDRATALGYVNQLRQRAYGNQSGNIADAELTLDFVLDERARELWWEGHRRTDLIRYGLFTGGTYIWSWKGGTQAGGATPEYLNLYPIPASELVANPNLQQNEGY
ncbi:MAG: RagB/SusD family nutrient uptake outer membrane protein [Gemmatimonadota bacterium]|nr:MAG: RagB/SusD family nutrient uptake outer membrane protein [Gemmatimonadota bacterium]